MKRTSSYGFALLVWFGSLLPGWAGADAICPLEPPILVGSWGSIGDGPGQFIFNNGRGSLCVDIHGNVYVADADDLGKKP